MSSLYPRPTPAIVRWSRRIVWTRRLSGAVRNSSSAPTVSTSGPSFASGPSSPGASTHHPAFRCLPNSFTRIDGRSSVRNRTPAARGFVALGGASTSIRPPCDRCTRIRLPSRRLNSTYFPRLVTCAIAAPGRSLARGVTVLSDENCRRSAPRSVPPAVTSSSRSASARISGSSGIGSPADRGRRLADDPRALVDPIGVRPMRHDADAQPVLAADQRGGQEHPLRCVDPLEERTVRGLLPRPEPEGDDRQLRPPAHLERGVRGERRVRAFGEVELLVEGIPERGDAVQRQRPPHAQPPHVTRELGRQLVVVRQLACRRQVLQVRGALEVRVPHRGPVADDEPTGSIRQEQALVRVEGDAVRALATDEPPPSAIGQDEEPAVRRVDVEPQL